ncbi:MAG: proline--tRNA ligase [Phycisphaeraceae bacterium]|nr:proline--tRNA ligase [Phycisphaeraceae bacterium]
MSSDADTTIQSDTQLGRCGLDHTRAERPGRGVIHTWGSTLIPTTREAPSDAESPSHILLSRAGYIRKLGSGIYDYLPLAWRTLRRISQIVREEMDAAGASELNLPVLLPIELYAGTRRDADYGDLLFKVTDRKGAVAALGPTHEEPITELVKGSINSYKQLPINLYQIQTKFRDEARPRSGLLRCREFIMKDAYSFHTALEGAGGLNETYDKMYAAYTNVFRRCGLDFTAVEAESGPIGGSASHEFMVNAPSGEDTILKCPVSGYAANVEKCEIGDRGLHTLDAEPTGELAEVHTPNLPGIDEVGKFMKVKPDRMLKTIVFAVTRHDGSRHWAIAVVRGDHDVNEGKVKIAVREMTGDANATVSLADEKAARAAGFAIGYVSPKVINSVKGTLLIIDHDAAQGGFWASGADKPDHHVKHFNWKREVGPILADLRYVKVGDARNAMAGDPSPRATGSRLETARGIEVGHIFKLGTKYSQAMGLSVLDAHQQSRPVIMGCYGIGVSRTMAASVEQNHDADGIVWPPAIAPYHVLITVLKPDAPEHREAARTIADRLASSGMDVLIDDRDERPGVKFKDADLIGLPVRLTIGDKALAEGAVEFKARRVPGKGEIVPLSDTVAKCRAAMSG